VGNVNGGGITRAGVWTPATGMVTLVDYLGLYGVTLPPDMVPQFCTGVSEDGRTIVGYGSLNGQTRGFVATVPAPAAGLALLGLLAFRRARLVRSIASG